MKQVIIQNTSDKSSDKQNHHMKRIVAVVFPHFVTLDLIGPLEAFRYATSFLAQQNGESGSGYRIELVARQAGSVASTSGVQIIADRSYLDFHQPVDILLLPGMTESSHNAQDDDLCSWIATQATRSERIASVCTGAFLLGHAGLLDGTMVTTHWRHGNELQEAFPNALVDDSRIFCQSGNIYSSAGVTAGIDLALAIIEEDYGRPLALKIAKSMVMFLKRPGDQAQFSDLLSAQSTSSSFADLIDWVEQNLGTDLTVIKLADRCAMSPRSFSRNFKRELGHSPMQYVRKRRLEYARLLLEETEQPLIAISRLTGFISPERMARAFVGAYHTSPGQYRQRFR